MREINVALLGFGNVGRAFADYIERANANNETNIIVRAVADSSGGILLDRSNRILQLLAHKESGRSVREFAPDNSIKDMREFIGLLSSAGVSVLAESLPTNLKDGQPALDLLAEALSNGMDVVTVDKGPLVYGFDKLKEAGRESGSQLGYTGTTGVRIPDEISGERVLEIRGILNGTTNHILTEMQESAITFEQALEGAQAKGIAEPDPSQDLEGWDTAVKTLILAKTLMGAEERLDQISRIGIGPETESLIQVGRESNRLVRLAGRARIWQGRVRVSVAPKLVGRDSPFYKVSGTSKAAVFRTEERGEVWSFARSGRDAISQTILDDIILVMREK